MSGFTKLMYNSFQILCPTHKQPGIYVNPNKNDSERPVFCEQCLEKVDDQIELNKKLFNHQTQTIIDKLKFILDFKEKLIHSLNQITTSIQQHLNNIQLNQNKFEEQFVRSKIMKRNQANEQDFLQLEESFDKLILIELQQIKQKFDIDHLIQYWKQQVPYQHRNSQYSEVLRNQINKEDSSKQNELVRILEQVKTIPGTIPNYQDQNLQFQYSEVLDSIEQNNNHYCYAIAINFNNTVVAAVCGIKIRMLELQNDKLKDIQELLGHSKTVQCLSFMKKSKQLVSACCGGEIRIWTCNDNQIWKQVYLQKDHENFINCLQINKKEDLIISGSDDKKIKFWEFRSEQLKCVQTLDMQKMVDGFSLNQSNNKLIVCMREQNCINLIKLNGNIWEKVQQIIIPNYAYRLCYLNDNQFVVQLSTSDKLLIFNSDGNNDQFKQVQEIQVKKGAQDYSLFPIQYIQSNGILIDKNCQYINILRKQENGQFNVIQIIDQEQPRLFGCVSDDGQYLITWDRHSNKILVRKLEIQIYI